MSSASTLNHDTLQSNLQLSSLERGVVLQLAGTLARRILEQRQRVEHDRAKTWSRQGTNFWLPRVDVFDDPTSPDVIAVFELPGVRREDARVNVRDSKLIVEGVRPLRFKHWNASRSWADNECSANTNPVLDDKNIHEAQDSNYTSGATEAQVPRSVAELRYGRFKREIPLPEGLTHSHVRVLLENGMLHVQWPRSAPTQLNSPKRAYPDSAEESATSVKRHCQSPTMSNLARSP